MKPTEPIDFKQAFGDVPDSFANRVTQTLRQLDDGARPKSRVPLRTAIVVAVLLALTVTALAAVLSHTVDWFGSFYGDDIRQKLEEGALAPGGQSVRVGDVIFTLNDAVAVETVIPVIDRDENGHTLLDDDGEPLCHMVESVVIYATAVLSPAEGANVVLLPEDYTPGDVYGYDLIYGELRPEDIPPDAPSYADRAADTGAALRQVRALGNWFALDEDSPFPCDIGYTAQPQQDGTILISAEFVPAAACEPADCYSLSFYIAQESVDEYGDPLPDSLVALDWVVQIHPGQSE